MSEIACMHGTIKGEKTAFVLLSYVWSTRVPLATKKRQTSMSKGEWKGEQLWLYQLWWRGGQDPNKMTARKIWHLPLLYSLLDVICSVWHSGGCVHCTVHLYWRRGWGRKPECWPRLASWPAQLEDSGPVGVIFTMMDAGKGNPCCLIWQELLSCEHLAIPASGIHHIVVWEWHWPEPTLRPLASLVKETT
jgi:hypothetical protein